MRFILWLTLGLILGPSWLGIEKTPLLQTVIQSAGGLFLFLAGFELRFSHLKEDKIFYRMGFIGSFVIPVVIGYFAFERNLFMAFAMGISALPVAIQILKEKGLYKTLLAERALTLASLCDILPWLALIFILPAKDISSWLTGHWVVLCFFLGIIAGRFTPKEFPSWFQGFQTWILSPIFFIGLGWGVDLLRYFEMTTFLKVLTFAVLTKFLGSYVFFRISGQRHFFSWNLAWLLNARGAMEIIAAQFAFEAGLISAPQFSALVLLGVVTSLMAIPLVRTR
ncbi:Na/H antiporter [Bdellovibrio bacteriovorus W]|nr:Na/H antiporter [Bdellovibrio bacteriovorus W]